MVQAEIWLLILKVKIFKGRKNSEKLKLENTNFSMLTFSSPLGSVDKTFTVTKTIQHIKNTRCFDVTPKENIQWAGRILISQCKPSRKPLRYPPKFPKTPARKMMKDSIFWNTYSILHHSTPPPLNNVVWSIIDLQVWGVWKFFVIICISPNKH